MQQSFFRKRYSNGMDKLHVMCPCPDRTGINIHVVIKEGACYRSRTCLASDCKYNKTPTDHGVCPGTSLFEDHRADFREGS